MNNDAKATEIRVVFLLAEMSMPASLIPVLTCKRCNRIFNDPVSLPRCSHKFCRECIFDGDVNEVVPFNCPECGEQSVIRPNEPLASDPVLAAIVASFGPLNQANEGHICNEEHVRELYCTVEKMEICTDCFTFSHSGHEVYPLRCQKLDVAKSYIDRVAMMEADLERKREDLQSQQNKLHDYVEATDAAIQKGNAVNQKQIKEWTVSGTMVPSRAVDDFFNFVQEYKRLMAIEVHVTEGGVHDAILTYKIKNISTIDTTKHYHSKPVSVKGVKWRITVKLDPWDPKTHIPTKKLQKIAEGGGAVGKSMGGRDDLMLGVYLNATLHNFRKGEKYSVEHEMRIVRQIAHEDGDEIRTNVNEFPATNGALISGWPDFVSYTDLCDSKNGWLKNDTVEVVCEFKVTKMLQGKDVAKKSDSNDSDDDQMQGIPPNLMNALFSRMMASN